MAISSLRKSLLPILFEDSELLAVCKPPGIDLGDSTSAKSGGLIELLQKLDMGKVLLPTNRLSRYESGVVLLAKNRAMAEHLRKGMRAGSVDLEYVVVSMGRMATARMVIDSKHGGSRGKRDVGNRRQNKTSRATTSRAAGDGRTTLQKVKSSKRMTLLRCRTTVSTTHALRAQLRSAGLRAAGDAVGQTHVRRGKSEQTCMHLVSVSFHHPIVKKKTSIGCGVPNSYADIVDGGFGFERMLETALVRRIPLLESSETNAYRLIGQHGEGVKGVEAQRYDSLVMIQSVNPSPQLDESWHSIARWYKRKLGVETIYLKKTGRRMEEGNKTPTPYEQTQILVGKALTKPIVMREYDLQYLIKADGGQSVGLFLDHRENRHRIRQLSQGKKVLNLFAYTCGFSVAAARGGASETVSVDLSTKSLDWGRENFELNSIPTEGHEFVTSDTFEYLKWAKRQDLSFDVIILDPPTFSHGRKSKQDFSVTRDLHDLVRHASEVLCDKGVIFVSSNYRKFTAREIKNHVKRGCGSRGMRVMSQPGLPVDFAKDADHCKSIIVKLDP